VRLHPHLRKQERHRRSRAARVAVSIHMRRNRDAMRLLEERHDLSNRALPSCRDFEKV
jgi:hypothetical protein